jgi:L-threonylcarbamoyladenylate synthase
MKTKKISTNELAAAAEVLRGGGLIAFPTETVYGLGANATSDEACKRIYAAKGRPNDNPFIVHVCNVDEVENVAFVCEIARKLFKTFSPGPITVVMQKKTIICNTATAGLNSVGVRIPSHPIAQKFLKLCAVPVAAPSANISGQLSPTTAKMVLQDLSGKIDGIIESDDIDCGLESTVVSVLDGNIRLLRQGAISLEDLENCLKISILVADEVKKDEIMQSPGQKYKHYSPKIPLELVDSTDLPFENYFDEAIGVLTLVGARHALPLPANWHIKTFETVEDYARELYKTMDEMGHNSCTRIIAVLPPNIGIGRAIRNRLMRASCKSESRLAL